MDVIGHSYTSVSSGAIERIRKATRNEQKSFNLIRHRPVTGAKLTFVLLDWSCRESNHFLDYLREQSLPRDQYEIVWIEYYDRHDPDLNRRLEAAEHAGRHPDVDTYVVMNMPKHTYYHKHLMYNLGLVLASGRIVCYCDSDALAHRDLVESIVREFDADPDIVLHLDEVRNHDRRFYPFNYPPLDDVVGPGCTNWLDGRPTGLLDPVDALHTRNYGACMCALRSDLIAIGGADMHRDYLGHICGPYEMTFRLKNAGRREVWHSSQWLYHVWHPGQAGDNNYAGPSDGAQMSTTALEAAETGRVMPLVENPAIARLRTADETPAVETLLDHLVDPAWLDAWSIDKLQAKSKSYQLGNNRIDVLETDEAPPQKPRLQPRPLFGLPLSKAHRLWIACIMAWMVVQQFRLKLALPRFNIHTGAAPQQGSAIVRKLRNLRDFAKRMWHYNVHCGRRCWNTLAYLSVIGCKEVVIYGDAMSTCLLHAAAGAAKIKVRAVYPLDDPSDNGSPVNSKTGPLSSWPGTVLLGTFVDIPRRLARLHALGIPRERIIVLQ